ncbi:hypothetical protein SRABI04_02988 [Chryseobacterium sp. Bi04]|nr:hypothetical protein SRABI04_02988 [Chryseobacterium sp. Bi04]
MEETLPAANHGEPALMAIDNAKPGVPAYHFQSSAKVNKKYKRGLLRPLFIVYLKKAAFRRFSNRSFSKTNTMLFLDILFNV